MILTIWRHGEAEAGAVDRQRNLTTAGRDDVGFGCRQFHEACLSWGLPHPTVILFSPWVRTAQTSEIIAGAFTHAVVCAEQALQPGSNLAAVDAAVCDREKSGDADQHLLLVSHQPLVSQLVDHYLGADAGVPSLSPGGLAALSLDTPAAGCGRLLFWAMPPEYEAVV